VGLLLAALSSIVRTSIIYIDACLLSGWYMELLESVFIGIFLTESVIELYVYRFRYFFSVWHVMGEQPFAIWSPNVRWEWSHSKLVAVFIQCLTMPC